jgi:ubiquinone/menaquinone biosynthesis C-methylase UbiE
LPIGPQTWHYGVVARWWALFNTNGPEIAYFQRFIEDGGEPALDVACGTGRLLVPWLRAGLDVDGCDISADMLALCRERAEREGLSPQLYAQPMHALQLPRRYRTIVVCGGFGLGSTREQDFAALRRFHDLLEPGGLLLLDNETPYNQKWMWKYWLADERASLPEAWPEPGERRTGPDGAQYALRARMVDADPLAQSATMEMRGWMWRDGELVAEDEHRLTLNLYFRNELELMLEKAGFADIAVRGDYTDEEPTADSGFLVFVARKPYG